MTRSEFEALAAQGVLLLDGATGSNLRLAGMPVGVCTELWALEHPEVILELQRSYVEAGSRVIYAPTFSANRLGLRMHGLESRMAELNRGLVALSREAAGGRAFVAGDMTTTGRAPEPKGDISYVELYDVYGEQAQLLAGAGANLLVLETMLSIEETSAALDAARAACSLPVMCSLTVESDGRLLFGGTVVEAVEMLQELGASAVGLNCSVGPDQLEAPVRAMAEVARVPVIAKPNAGMPVIGADGVARYDMDAARFAESMRKLIDCGARIIGGCCGTTPEYIRALAKAIAGREVAGCPAEC